MSRVLPILFNTDMVQAILAERKTVTRRVTKGIVPFDNDGEYWNTLRKGEWTGPIIKELMIRQKAPYQPGDILYVRETWCRGSLDYNDEQYYYKADNNKFPCQWRPSIHMPKAAARIWLRVTDVRVERLQDMDTADDRNYIAEGAKDKHDFIRIWDSTVKDKDTYGWYANPWACVIKFERCKKPEGEDDELK